MVLVQARYIDQQSRIESPEINSYIYQQLICDKSDKTKGETVFNKELKLAVTDATG